MGGEPKNNRSSDLHALDELIQKWIVEYKLQDHLTTIVKIPDSPLSVEIQECEFPGKFSTSTCDYYARVSDPVQHIQYFQENTIVYSHNDPVMCFTFPFSLKDAASGWFYALPLHSLHNFGEVTEAFLTQYASRQEVKNNIHHLLSVKMR